MVDNDPIKERLDKPTPKGGVASEIYYHDDEGNAVPKSKATCFELVELDAKGNQIYRTHGSLKPNN